MDVQYQRSTQYTKAACLSVNLLFGVMAAMLRDSVVVVIVVVHTRPRAKPVAMITMRKSTHGFPFVSHVWAAYGALLLTKSEVITGKSQTEALMYWPSDSEVNTLRPRSEICL